MPRIAMERACYCCHRNFSARVLRGSVQDLCEFCYEEAGYENAHTDGHHDAEENGPDSGCHICQGTDPHEGFAPVREAAAGAGRVTREDDGRLRGNAPTLPEAPARVKLTGMRLGRPANKWTGEASVIKADNHVWGGHSNWVMVVPDGMTQRRWFWAEDVTPVRAPRSRRAATALLETGS